MAMETFALEYETATKEFLETVGSLSNSNLDISDNQGWSPRQIIHHMADSETQSYARLRRLIAEPNTEIQGYDENVWSESSVLGYRVLAIDLSLDVIRAVRNSSCEIIRRLPDEFINNTCFHSEIGKFSIGDWISTYTKHPIDHSNQIKALLKTLGN
jgi:hypothetical protein